MKTEPEETALDICRKISTCDLAVELMMFLAMEQGLPCWSSTTASSSAKGSSKAKP